MHGLVHTAVFSVQDSGEVVSLERIHSFGGEVLFADDRVLEHLVGEFSLAIVGEEGERYHHPVGLAFFGSGGFYHKVPVFGVAAVFYPAPVLVLPYRRVEADNDRSNVVTFDGERLSDTLYDVNKQVEFYTKVYEGSN